MCEMGLTMGTFRLIFVLHSGDTPNIPVYYGGDVQAGTWRKAQEYAL